MIPTDHSQVFKIICSKCCSFLVYIGPFYSSGNLSEFALLDFGQEVCHTHTSYRILLADSSSSLARQAQLLTFLLGIYGKQTERRDSDMQNRSSHYLFFVILLN